MRSFKDVFGLLSFRCYTYLYDWRGRRQGQERTPTTAKMTNTSKTLNFT